MARIASRKAGLSLVAVLWVAALFTFGIAAPVEAALTPESPEVRAVVDKGIAFLEKNSDPRFGASSLAALVMVKDGRAHTHPKIEEAVKDIREMISKPPIAADVYSTGLSIIFLVELDPSKYRREIETLIKYLLSIQQAAGGWGYPGTQTGDTSMTQYGVLSMWEAGRAGFATPPDAWERVANWLLRTQDPNGAWGYQGTDPGTFELVAQSAIRPSMSAAGLGSVFICTDQFGMTATAAPAAGQSAMLRPIQKASQRINAAKVNAGLMAAARTRGDEWMTKNYTLDPSGYKHYYFYALERYQSFREVLTGRPFSHPSWYDEVARDLMKTQTADGSWAGECAPVPDTSFSLLFLLRSSRKSLGKSHGLGDGMLVGGRGFPTESGEIEIRLGKVVAKPLAGPAEQLMSIIGDARNPDYLRAVEGLEEFVSTAGAPELGKQAKRLRELAGSAAPEARATALHALGRTRNLDDAPLLIQSLADPDPGVFHAAEDGLRWMSRKFAPPGDPVDPDDAARLTAIKHWKSWYLSLRPAAILDD